MLEKLKDLKELFDNGVINQEEYNSLKAEIIANGNVDVSTNLHSQNKENHNQLDETSPIIATSNEFWNTTIEQCSKNYNSPLQPYCINVDVLQKGIFSNKELKLTITQIASRLCFLKGEFLIAITEWGFHTNYRLVYNYTGTIYSIPLCNIQKYSIDENKGLTIIFKYKGQEVEHFLISWFRESTIRREINEAKNKTFSLSELNIIESDVYEIKKQYPQVGVQPLTFNNKIKHNEIITPAIKVLVGCFVLFVLYFSFSFFGTDIKDEKSVIESMQGIWVGYDHNGGMYTHYKLDINNDNFSAWYTVTYTNDEPQWTNEPDEKGEYSLSPVQGYTNTSGNYRNINFRSADDRGYNSIISMALTKMIVYDEGPGLYIVGWGQMSSK